MLCETPRPNRLWVTILLCVSSFSWANTHNGKKVDKDIERWPALTSVVEKQPALEKKINQILSRMSDEEKVGQLIQPEIKYATADDVRKYHLGSVLNGGGTAPNNNKYSSVDDWVYMTNEYYKASMDTSDGNIAIPLIWGSDAVHGHNNVVGATLFPHNIGLGAAGDPDLIRRIGMATAKEVAVTGVDWTFAPTVAVARDDRWGRTYESYSEDPEIVHQYATMMVEGLQGSLNTRSFLDGQHVVATAKHFLADGGTFRGIDRGDATISEQELIDVHSPGFVSALESGAQTIMASFNSWNGEKLHGSHYLMTTVLKERLGFDGFVVGDWNAHRFVDGCTVDSCAPAINAGLDMLMTPSDWKPLYNNTLSQVKMGHISQSRLNDAVRRILRVKLRAGLFDKGPVTERELSAKKGIMGGKKHRELAREAVRKSLVLLKNNDQTLPINPTKNILVVGDSANDISLQSGGWTISWQGTGNSRRDFQGATTIFEGIKSKVLSAGGEAVFAGSSDVTKFQFANNLGPDAIIFVYGEKPYAEWHGDIAGIEYQLGRKTDLGILKALKEHNVPITSIFLSGRPLWVNKELNASDAFVAAWLPGSEGAGLADVIMSNSNGDIHHDFQGRLSFSWPKYVNQTVINKGDAEYDPLFAYGYGLDYKSSADPIMSLNELGGKFDPGKLDDAWVLVSRVMPPWDLILQEKDGAPNLVSGNFAQTKQSKTITARSVDRVSQEDARSFEWAGNVEAGVYFKATSSQDFTPYVNENGALTFDFLAEGGINGALVLELSCGINCDYKIRMKDLVGKKNIKQWKNVSLPLKCIADKGFDFSKIETVFSLKTRSKNKINLSNIKVVPRVKNNDMYACPI